MVCVWGGRGFRRLAHLGEVDAERVGVVVPGDVDVRLGAPALTLDLCALGQSERRVLGDQLRGVGTKRTDYGRWSSFLRTSFTMYPNIQIPGVVY